MALFESTLVLLVVAVVLLRLADRLRVPYPALLALAGVGVAVLPFAPRVDIEPHLALALFVAPAVLDTAFDMAPRELLRNWLPLLSLAVLLVLVTAFAVAGVGVIAGGLPFAAALALGAIVAPPDAAAAAAVLQRFDLPRRTLAVLQGESLLNDAVALLLFGAAVAAVAGRATPHAAAPLGLLIAVPGGALLGAAMAALMIAVARHFEGTLAAIMLQFASTFGTWVLAERLQLSAIVAIVTLAMLLAHVLPARTQARDRVHAYAVWAVVVFLLNVLAFLLMGLQARAIVERLSSESLLHSLSVAGLVLVTVVAVRFVWVMGYGVLLRSMRGLLQRRAPGVAIPSARIGVLASWCGMRGLVTLATAFALPDDFPGRDLIVLSAFVVVLGTLVLQGFTIRPLVQRLRIQPDRSMNGEISRARVAMFDAALATLPAGDAPALAAVRAEYAAARAIAQDERHPQAQTPHDRLRVDAIAAQRRELAAWRREGRIDDDTYHRLEEELDHAELAAADVDAAALMRT